jgi:hypothetical protein
MKLAMCGGVNHEASDGQRFKNRGAADVGMNDFHAERGRFATVEFAVEAMKLPPPVTCRFSTDSSRAGQGAARKSADASDENSHAEIYFAIR